jgi:hypothetical protein
MNLVGQKLPVCVFSVGDAVKHVRIVGLHAIITKIEYSSWMGTYMVVAQFTKLPESFPRQLLEKSVSGEQELWCKK